MKHLLFSFLMKPLAWCIARVRINRVTRETISGGEFIRKERLWFSWILIVLGNCVFRFRRAPVRVLHRRQWQQWEGAIHEAQGVDVPSQTPRGLLLFKISGKPLCDVVDAAGRELPFDEVVERLKLALEALYRLHQTEIVVDGKPVLLSHGDASVTNVIISDDGRSATWFDFDLRHDLRKPASLRHADDLRAFYTTAAMCLLSEEGVEHEELVEQTVRFGRIPMAAYPNEETWQRFLDEGGIRASTDVFLNAQRIRALIARWRYQLPQ